MLYYYNDYIKLYIVFFVFVYRKWSVGIIIVCYRVINWMYMYLEFNFFVIFIKMNFIIFLLIIWMLLELYLEIRNNWLEFLFEIINN